MARLASGVGRCSHRRFFFMRARAGEEKRMTIHHPTPDIRERTFEGVRNVATEGRGWGV